MANPFPGMDPYLEGDLWTSVHTDLCAEIARQLAPKLRPKYVVLSARRVILAPSADEENLKSHRFPDVAVLAENPTANSTSAWTAVAPLTLIADFPEPIPHVSLEIRDVAERRLVTCIGVLSPTNKRGPGREEYQAKRLQMVAGDAHLIEIDLLREGARYPVAEPLPKSPYFVFICHAGRPTKVDVWPIVLERPLPEIPVPLLPDDRPVALELQAALDGIYGIFGYDELIDYSKPPRGPLTESEAAWINDVLVAAGRR